MTDQILIRRDSNLIATGWTAVPNAVIRDKNLSIGARWLWSYINSHNGTFALRMTQMQEMAGVGRDKMRLMIKELEAAGHLSREQASTGGQYGLIVYTLHTAEPATAEPATAEPATENQSPAATSENVTGDVFPVDGEHDPLKKTTSTTSRSSAVADDPFDEFWAEYHRKTHKVKGRQAYAKAIKKADPLVILEGLKRFTKAYLQQNPNDKTYFPHAASWLSGERWEDEVLQRHPKPSLRPCFEHRAASGRLVDW